MVEVNALILDSDTTARSQITQAIDNIPAIKLFETAALGEAVAKAREIRPSIIVLGMTVGFSEVGRCVAALRGATAKAFICWISGHYDVMSEKMALMQRVNVVFGANDFEALVQNVAAVCGEIAANGIPDYS